MKFNLMLSDVAVIVDCEHKTAPESEPGNEYGYSVGTKSLAIGDIDFSKAKKIDEITFLEWSRRAVLKEGDLVLAREAPVGGVGYIDGSVPICLGQRTVLVRPNANMIVPKYLFCYLRSPLAQEWLHEMSTGTTVLHINVADVKKMPIPHLPVVAAQSWLSETICTIDDKIRLNTEISKTLEAIARTIFQSWFIDFDPVHAKMRGEKPEGMDDATAALFPKSFEESELGLIPKGWKVKQVREVCETVVNGSTPLRSEANYWTSADIPWFKTGELADGFLYSSSEGITESALKKTSVKLLPAGTVLMAIYAAPTVGRLGILTNEATFNQACTGMVPKPEFGSAFLYLYLRSQRNWFNSFAVGSAQQNISKAIVESAPVVSPGINIQTVFRNIAEPLFSLIKKMGSESNNLSSIRDALLPRLISGELEIPHELLAS